MLFFKRPPPFLVVFLALLPGILGKEWGGGAKRVRARDRGRKGVHDWE